MKNFRHSGKAGDVLFSLPTIRYFGGGNIYLPERSPECSNLYTNIMWLLRQQPYIHNVIQYPDTLTYDQPPADYIDIDLDRHRQHPMRGKVNMVKRYYEIFGINADYKSPWLTLVGERKIKHSYNLIQLTPRFRDDSRVDWKKIYTQIKKPVYFIGTTEEHATFVDRYGNIDHLHTNDLLQFALLIKYSDALFCNQSAGLAIAQAIGKTYYLEIKPRKSNCRMGTANENILV